MEIFLSSCSWLWDWLQSMGIQNLLVYCGLSALCDPTDSWHSVVLCCQKAVFSSRENVPACKWISQIKVALDDPIHTLHSLVKLNSGWEKGLQQILMCSVLYLMTLLKAEVLHSIVKCWKNIRDVKLLFTSALPMMIEIDGSVPINRNWKRSTGHCVLAHVLGTTF